MKNKSFKRSYSKLFCIATVLCSGIVPLKSEASESVKICALSVASAIAYGIVHDQITTRICLEYFTEGFHLERILEMPAPLRNKLLRAAEDKSATTTGLIWGVIATAPLGLFLSIPLMISARSSYFGNQKVTAAQLIKPIALCGAITGGCSILGGLLRAGLNTYVPETEFSLKYFKADFKAGATPLEKIKNYAICASAHEAGYLGATLSGLGLSLYTLKSLRK